MSPPMTKIKVNDLCPCGSDKKFKKCCKGKDFTWKLDDTGNYYRTLPVNEKIDKLIDELDKEIYNHFERQRLPDDPLMLHTLMYSNKDTTRKMVEVMEKVGTDPAFIYAYKKTGVLLSEEMVKRAPGSLIEEWDQAVNEYDDFGGDPEDAGEDKQFELILSRLVEDIESLIYLFGLAINKYFNSEHLDDSIPDGAEILSPAAYIGLNVARSQRVLRSIKYLINEDYDEDALKLVRSLYEGYLHIILIKHQPESIITLVDVKYGLRDGSFVYVDKNGKQDRRQVMCLATGKIYPSHISGYKMAEASHRRAEIEFYDLFYQRASDVVHPSIFNVKDYVRNDVLDPLDSDWKEEAAIYSIFIGCLIATELMNIKQLPNSLTDDCATVSRRLLTNLNEALDFLKIWTNRIGIQSPELEIMHNWSNEILDALSKRTS